MNKYPTLNHWCNYLSVICSPSHPARAIEVVSNIRKVFSKININLVIIRDTCTNKTLRGVEVESHVARLKKREQRQKFHYNFFLNGEECFIPVHSHLSHLPWTKWPQFRRRHLQRYFHEWNILIQISLKVIPKGPIDNKSVLLHVMAWRPNSRQGVIWTNADQVHWRIYAALGKDWLRSVSPDVQYIHWK